jgi:leucyl-tRNA synthetase
MSKSTGNFMTLQDAIELFGADATRFALADAGDGLEDANFTVKTANSAILRLTKEDEWINEIISSIDTLRDGPQNTLMDQIFANDINRAIIETDKAYASMQFRAGLKSSVYELINDRNFYRAASGNGIHKELILRYIEVFILLISPICPHWAEKKWKDLKKPGLVVNAPWPVAGSYDPTLTLKAEYIKDLSRDVRLGFETRATAKKGKKPSQEDLRPVRIFRV